MKQSKVFLALAILLAAIFPAGIALAQQALPTASRALEASAFAGLSGSYTGLSGGRNMSITAGGDLSFPPFHGIQPGIELRGIYPVDDGSIDSQRSVLGGLKVDFLLNHRFHPYVDFLAGRGQMDYLNGGYVFNNNIYVLTTTNIFSPGLGVDYDLGQHFAAKFDGQFQSWSAAPTASGNIYSKIGTVGLVYRFNFGRYPKR